MGIGKALLAREITSRRFEQGLVRIDPTEDAGWLVGSEDPSQFFQLDHRLVEIRRIDFHLRQEFESHTWLEPSTDLRFVAIASPTELKIMDSRGCLLHRFPHDAWESYCGSGCLFDRRGRLWSVLPGEERGCDDRLTVINPASGEIVVQRVIFNGMGYFQFHLGPDDDAIMVQCSCGQDGTGLYLARLNGSELAIAEFESFDRTFSGGFSPTGTEFVTGAHEGQSLKVHSFPDGALLASLGNEAIFADDPLVTKRPDEVGYEAKYLDANHILARTRFGRLLLIERSGMRLLGTIWPDREKLREFYNGEIDYPHALIGGRETGLRDFLPARAGEMIVRYLDDSLRLIDVTAYTKGV